MHWMSHPEPRHAQKQTGPEIALRARIKSSARDEARINSARPAAQHAEERLDIRIGAGIAVAVEVGAAARGAAVAGKAGEEGLDVGVGS